FIQRYVVAGRLPPLLRFVGRGLAHGAIAVLRDVQGRHLAAARTVLLSNGGELLQRALYDRPAAAGVRDGGSRIVDVLVERRRGEGLVAAAVGAPRAGGRGQVRRVLFLVQRLRAALVARGGGSRGGAQRPLLIRALLSIIGRWSSAGSR